MVKLLNHLWLCFGWLCGQRSLGLTERAGDCSSAVLSLSAKLTASQPKTRSDTKTLAVPLFESGRPPDLAADSSCDPAPGSFTGCRLRTSRVSLPSNISTLSVSPHSSSLESRQQLNSARLMRAQTWNRLVGL